MPGFDWIALYVIVRKQTFGFWFILGSGQADNNHMNVRGAPRIGAPCEGSVCKCYFEFEAIKKKRPKLCDLLSLGDRVCRHEADSGLRFFQIFAGLEKPRANVIQCSTRPTKARYSANLRTLICRLIFCSAKWRITINKGAPFWSQDLCPVLLQRVGAMDMRRGF